MTDDQANVLLARMDEISESLAMLVNQLMELRIHGLIVHTPK
jgi:hypothetical protein